MEVINPEDRTIGKKNVSHKEMYKNIHANSKINPGFMELEKIVIRTVEKLKLVLETFLSSIPHTLLEDSWQQWQWIDTVVTCHLSLKLTGKFSFLTNHSYHIYLTFFHKVIKYD